MLTLNGLLARLLDVALILGGATLGWTIRADDLIPSASATAVVASTAAFSAAISLALFPAAGAYETRPARSRATLAGQIMFAWLATQIRQDKVARHNAYGLAAFPQLAKLGDKELVSSWYSNAIFSGAKHVDVIIAAMLLGPAGAALYRGAKSVHNVAFNLGQALALVVHSCIRACGNAGMREWFLTSTNRLSVSSAFTLGAAASS